MTSCKNTQPGDQCREVYCESGIQQWRAIPGEHLCYVEQAGAITCLEVTRFTRPYFCLQPQSFGYTNDVFPPAIRVQHGCSAEFRVCFTPPVFSDSLYQGPGFEYVDHSNDYRLTTTQPSSSTTTSTKSSNNSSSNPSVTPPSTSPTVTPPLDHTQNTSSTEIHHSSSVVTFNTTPYIAVSVPSICVLGLVAMVIFILWRRSKRKEQRNPQTHCDKDNTRHPTRGSSPDVVHIEPGTSHSEVDVDGILNKPGGKIFVNSDRICKQSISSDVLYGSKSSSSCDMLNRNEPINRRSEHIYYTLETAAKYRQQRESIESESTSKRVTPSPVVIPSQSVKSSKTCHDINRKGANNAVKEPGVRDDARDGPIHCLSEEMYDNLRNRWSEYSEDRYDHMNAYVTLCRNNNNRVIVGQEYAHLNTST